MQNRNNKFFGGGGFQLEEELSGVVEVIGMVSNKGAIMAYTYNMLREDKGIPFGGFRPPCCFCCFSDCDIDMC